MFQGFSQQSIDFLWGISFNNDRGWFQAHKQEFLDHVDTPMKLLAREITDRMQEKYPELGLELKISRIYRDARRLFGRGPYKDHLWFTLRRPGTSEGATPCFYFEIAPQCYSIGVGAYDPTPLTMAKLRARIDRDPEPLARLARRVNKREEFRLYGEMYKRPKGDPGALLFPWYNRRQIGVSADYNCEGLLFSAELADQIMEHFTFLAPLYTYLRELPGDPVPEGY